MKACKFVRWNAALLLTAIAFTISLPPADCANILGVFTSHSQSHLIVHMSVMKALAEKGHNITVVSAVEPKVTHKSIKQIVIPMNAQDEQKLSDALSVMAKETPSMMNLIKNIFTSLSVLINKQVDVLEDPRFTELYENRDNKFDVVFVGFFFNSYQVGLGAKFGCPLIVDWSGPPMDIVNEYVGNPVLVSSVPNMNLAVKQGEAMGFKKRIANFVSTSAMKLLTTVLDYRFSNFYRRLFGADKNMPSYAEALKNVSLIFCNSHAISEGPIRPNVPAVIEIGGIQVKDKPDPLPEDISDFLKRAKNGAILFSLGSNLQGKHIQPETVDKIFKALASIKQSVIWKWENLEKTPGTSSNILYKKWLPQDDILAHPNIKLFITHAGKGGVSEAQYHGVPMLALPVFADQPGNADKLVEAGYGIRLDLLSLEVDTLKSAILEILQNPSYSTKLKEFSQLYRDRPMSAKESVVYWTEYVLRHHGAAHMQSPLVHMGIVDAWNLDVYALLIFVLILLYLITKTVIRFVFRKLFGKSKKVTAQSKKQKKH